MLSFLFNTKDPKDKFRKWFSKNEHRIFKHIENSDDTALLYEEIQHRLNKIDKNLCFEYSSILCSGKREFVISADGHGDVFHVVQDIVDEFPTLDNWEMKAFRQRLKEKEYSITMDDYSIGYQDIFFKYTLANDELGIDLYIDEYDYSGEMQNVVFVLLDALIGEYDMVSKIDWIEWHLLDRREEDSLHALIELPAVIDAGR